jgi:hypothetical protein
MCPAGKLAMGYRWENDAWSPEPVMPHGAFGAMGGLVTTGKIMPNGSASCSRHGLQSESRSRKAAKPSARCNMAAACCMPAAAPARKATIAACPRFMARDWFSRQ